MTGSPVGITALIVSHNSQSVLRRSIASLLSSSRPPDAIVVVDNASSDLTYLDRIEATYPLVTTVRLSENIGYCGGNNRGAELLDRDHHLLLLNPDAFVTSSFLREAASLLDQDRSIGAIGPKLLGAHQTDGSPTGRIDSAGIFQSRGGRFYDRGQGESDGGGYDETDLDVVALCAAAVLVRREALSDVTCDRPLFDPTFVMYKEDLDLSFRLRRAGWRTVYDGRLEVLHCRGWNPDRQAMPTWARRRSLVNEWRLWRRGWTPERSRAMALPYLLAKTVAVGLGR